ncbi:MAG: hypothetical protein EKK49_03375 [Rhodocyclaceae bacterium]|nr:MAG: hypothetical protein EKK49_03375 [Rhodocyclaceae bacterium]
MKQVIPLLCATVILLAPVDYAWSLDTGFASRAPSSALNSQQNSSSFMARKKLLAMRKGPGAQAGFGGVNVMNREGVRPEDLRPPSATMCAMQGISGHAKPSAVSRQEASGRVVLSTDPSSLSGQSADIYSACDSAGKRTRAGLRPGNGSLLVDSTGGRIDNTAAARLRNAKTKSIYDARTNMLVGSKATKDRTAGFANQPAKSTSLFDPITGGIKPPKVMSAYSVYQQTP